VRKRSDSVTLDAAEFILVVDALRLTKELCTDLEATTGGNPRAVEVRLLRLIKRLEGMGLC
jgi:hypothetical protein